MVTCDPSVSGNMSRWTTCGFFGRLNYDYQANLFEVNGRYDGSSRFRREISGSSSHQYLQVGI